MKRILLTIKCFLYGHQWKPRLEYYGTLDNGKKCFAEKFGDCERCGCKKK